MDAVSRQLKKGVLDIVLLKLLCEKTFYGYELMAALEEQSGGYFSVREGTIYPVLYRLEDAGHIESLWENTDARRGAPRKYYSITEGGRAYLAAAREELARFVTATQKIMEGF